MKPLAIHYASAGFTQRWIEYCEKEAIPFVKVDCYDSNIIDTLRDCSGLMWHWNYADFKDRLFARQLIMALDMLNIKVFPDFHTCWHFDDKIGQKYLLESIKAPIPKSFVFYDKKQALGWAKKGTYPVVFKLRVGAGSQNVKLINDFNEAKRIINRAFSRGFSHRNTNYIVKDRLEKFQRLKNKKTFADFLKSSYRYFVPRYDDQFIPIEKGYVYFQEFLSKNSHDTRLMIIGKRCFGLRRFNRKGDFRASGSGMIDYDPENIDERCVKIAFDVSTKLKAQSLALDFLFDDRNDPVIVEISYAFPTGDFTDNCRGYWDDKLNWHAGKHILQHLMIDLLLTEIEVSKAK